MMKIGFFGKQNSFAQETLRHLKSSESNAFWNFRLTPSTSTPLKRSKSPRPTEAPMATPV